MISVSFVIPLHNEEKNILLLIRRIVNFASNKKWNYEIIPVDDRSTDNTASLLKKISRENKRLNPVFRKKSSEEKGNTMGRALLEGTLKARGEFIIWTMGDLADDTSTYGKIIDKLETGFDLVFGSRYMPGGSRGNLDPLKAFLSSWGTLLAKVMFGVKVHDITNAFRGFRKNIIPELRLSSNGFSISPEFAIKAYLQGYKLGEVPTVYTNRVEGVSSFKLLKMIRSYLKLYLNLFYQYKIRRQIN
ncbi:hypothetical protein A3D03_02510 [Candidatus Gottesmanbacteria bacterium RIFCSPHIGHO2_02_FULL_40_13]|uniref:Glycosyltransferase 2-like domain-containing protein n=1 Tax=Candidatus Gottesmanbacteria bacterium RIFCSPHIGHO2_02_FULL_40_13 TaxID=1798384 RepID=A0A1F6AA17_9BACT|nr:MAG: hypothetical protein A3D03_02510 [Candidatus Gottesmanbacteria bacterium RIFCSPHIGHO2_02_FULL_40_13]